jgi:uncharacterized membrane protein YdjX (TVP38/TMEM64 family)
MHMEDSAGQIARSLRTRLVDTIPHDKIRSLRLASVILITLIVVLFAATQDLEHWRDFIRQAGAPGLVVAVGVFGLIGASPVPPEPLTLFLSTTFGPLVAMVVAGTGNLLAALIEYAVGRMLGDIVSLDAHRTRLPFGLGKLPLESPVFLVGARMNPFYAPKVIGLAAGAYHVPLRRFVWTTAVVTYSGAALLAYGSYGLLRTTQRSTRSCRSRMARCTSPATCEPRCT